MRCNHFLFWLAVMVGVCCMALAGDVRAAVKITLVGDSTVADYPSSSTLVGWGQVLAQQFKPGTVTINNQAVGGQSSKSYLNEGRWTIALATSPDYVFIQFGHNDNATGEFAKPTEFRTFAGEVPSILPGGHTARDYYRNNLTKYVTDARNAGAVPILVLSMERHVYDDAGHIKRFNEPYVNAALEIAAALDVDVIDLHTPSIALYEAQGDAATRYLHAEGGTDQSHFSMAGAQLYAGWVADGLRSENSPLAALLVPEPSTFLTLSGAAAFGLLGRLSHVASRTGRRAARHLEPAG